MNNSIYINKIEYRQVPCAPTVYVSSAGETITTAKQRYHEVGVVRPIKQRADRDGYMYVSVGGHKSRKKVRVHVAVLSAWLRQKRDGEVGRHLNDIKTDNNIRNLAWGSHQDNMNDCVTNRTRKGERNSSAKLTVEQVLDLRKQYIHKPLRVLAKENSNYSRFAIWAAVSGYTWAHLPGAIPGRRTCSKQTAKKNRNLNATTANQLHRQDPQDCRQPVQAG